MRNLNLWDQVQCRLFCLDVTRSLRDCRDVYKGKLLFTPRREEKNDSIQDKSFVPLCSPAMLYLVQKCSLTGNQGLVEDHSNTLLKKLFMVALAFYCEVSSIWPVEAYKWYMIYIFILLLRHSSWKIQRPDLKWWQFSLPQIRCSVIEGDFAQDCACTEWILLWHVRHTHSGFHRHYTQTSAKLMTVLKRLKFHECASW